MFNAFTSPPMPEWNGLSNDDRGTIDREVEVYSCPCCGTYTSNIYDIIRTQLVEREKRIFRYTMHPKCRVKMGRRVI
jgi:hypothetical protein